MSELTVGRFLTQLGERGFPVDTDCLSGAVNVADELIGRAEINATTGECLLLLMDGTKLIVKLGGIEE